MNLVDRVKNYQTLELLREANQITLNEHGKQITLERAIFLSWWCNKGDCAFCYMFAQKPLIQDPRKARRRVESILAEAEIVRRMGWNIEFLSGGYGSFNTAEIKNVAESILQITGKSVWLNVGINNELESYGDEVYGITGAVEAVNPELHQKICPSKPLDDIIAMLEIAGDLGFKKAITIILGLGETPDDLKYLFKMIKELGIDRVIFYSLNPHPNTPYADHPQPASLYYAGTVAATRIRFPRLKIIVGTWMDNLANIGPLILAGANGLTKFPLFKMFGTKYGKRIEDEVFWAGRELKGTFTDFRRLKGEAPQPALEPFIKRYISNCLNNKEEDISFYELGEEE